MRGRAFTWWKYLNSLSIPVQAPTPDATRGAQSTCIIALPMLEVDRPFSNQEFNMVGAWAVHMQRTSKKERKKQTNNKQTTNNKQQTNKQTKNNGQNWGVGG